MRDITDKERLYVQNKLLELLVAFRTICEEAGLWYSLAFGTVLGAVRHQGFIPWDTDADVYIRLEDKEKFREAFRSLKPKGITLIDYDRDKKCLQSHDSLVFENEELVGDIHLDIFPLVGAPSTEEEQVKFAKRAYFMDRIIRSKYVNINDCRPKNKPAVFLVKCALFFVPDTLLKKNIKYRETKYVYETAEFLMTPCGASNGREGVRREVFQSMINAEFCGELFKIPQDADTYLKKIYGEDYMTPIKW